jgi:DNA-binding ferritin-like protein
MKSRKQHSRNPVSTFLRILNIIKLFHWNTKVYSQHKATNELYEKLSELTDSYMEKYIGMNGTVLSIQSISLSTNFIDEIHTFRKFLMGLNSSSDLNNVRDEMLGEIHQFLYFWRSQ